MKERRKEGKNERIEEWKNEGMEEWKTEERYIQTLIKVKNCKMTRRRMRKNLNLVESKAPRYRPNANITCMTMLYPHLPERLGLVTDYVILDMIG